jgi:predicted MPP superfamily phosphohydrolase
VASILTRRRLVQLGAGAVIGGAAAGLYTWRIEPHRLEVVHRKLPIRRLPPRLAGRTLVQLSDVHVGPRVDDEYVRATFRRVAALAPDIVVITGDFTSYDPQVFDQVSMSGRR